MNLSNWTAIFALGLFSMPMTLPAQLADRAEILLDRYEAERAQGLIRLNEQFVTAFNQELANAMRANRLEEANSIKQQIEQLQAENQKLSAALNSSNGQAASTSTDNARGARDENQLGKKTISFPHTSDPDSTVTVDFERDWTASWLGKAGVRVPQTYRQEGPGAYYFWPAHEPPGVWGYKVKVSPDEKTAIITAIRTGDSVEAKIDRTR